MIERTNRGYSPKVCISWMIAPDAEFASAVRAHGIRRVAHEIGVSPTTVMNYLEGVSPVPDMAMMHICRLVGEPVPGATVRQTYDARGPGMRTEKITWTAAIRGKRAKAGAEQ